MTPEDVADFFAKPIAFHRALARVAGGVTAGLLLSQAMYWQRVMEGEWFYKKASEWIEETGLTRDEFQTARRDLVNAGLLGYEVRGVPATGHYRVDFGALISSLRETRNLVCGKPANKPAGGQQASSRGTRKLLTTEITKRLPTLSPLSADVFEQAWKAYPKRAGNNPRGRAMKQWNARVRAGVDPAVLLAAVARYAAFCVGTGKVGFEIVMMAATFFGADKPYEQGWEIPATPEKSPVLPITTASHWTKRPCRYCDAPSAGIVNGIVHCGAHGTKAMDQEPAPRVAA